MTTLPVREAVADDLRIIKHGWEPSSDTERCFSCKHNSLCKSEVLHFMEDYWCAAYLPAPAPVCVQSVVSREPACITEYLDRIQRDNDAVIKRLMDAPLSLTGAEEPKLYEIVLKIRTLIADAKTGGFGLPASRNPGTIPS